jgi:hypothetical protein
LPNEKRQVPIQLLLIEIFVYFLNFIQNEKIGKIVVLQDSIPIGRLKFKITIISDQSDTQPSEKNSSLTKRFEMAFISYASQDRSEVLKRVQMLNLVNLKFFTLEPGDKVENKDLCHVIQHLVFGRH